MPSGDFRDLTETQRDTTRALQTLVSEIRRSGPGELGRLTGSLNATGDRDRLQARVVREVVPLAAAERRGVTDGGEGDPVRDVERTLNSARSAIRELGSGLTASTKDLERTLAAFSGGLQGLLSGLAGGGGGLGSFLKGGFGLAGLGLKIAGLFGKDKPEPVVFPTFELPSRLALEAANTDSVLGGFPRFDRGQSGEPRSFGSAPMAPAQVVVNVNALDTQSFLDRSSDVARAVRDAMLHMHPINDMIGEL